MLDRFYVTCATKGLVIFTTTNYFFILLFPIYKPMKTSPTKLSLNELRKQCQIVQVVEHWNAWSKTRHDLFGIIDILAIRDGETVAVQSTSWSNTKSRINKMTESDALPHLRSAGWILLVHGWRKNKNGKYELKEIDIS